MANNDDISGYEDIVNSPSKPHFNNVLQKAASVSQASGPFSPQNPLLEAARSIIGPEAQAVGHYADTAGFGLPGLAMDRMLPQSTKDYLKPRDNYEKAGAIAGDIGGFIGPGGPEALGKFALGKLPKAMQISSKFGPTLLKGATEMGAQRAGFIPANMAQGADLGSEVKQTGLMSAIGAGTAGAGKALFGRQYAKESMKEGGKVSTALDEAKQKLFDASDNDPKLQSDPTVLYQKALDAADVAKQFSTPVPVTVRRWIKTLGDYVDKGLTIPASKVDSLRTEAAQFFKENPTKTGRAMQKAIRMVGGAASDELKSIAEKAGIDEWGPINEEASRSLGLEKKPGLWNTITDMGIPGAISAGTTFANTQNPLLTAAMGLGGAALSSNGARNALFAGIEKSGAGAVAKAATQSASRKNQ